MNELGIGSRRITTLAPSPIHPPRAFFAPRGPRRTLLACKDYRFADELPTERCRGVRTGVLGSHGHEHGIIVEDFFFPRNMGRAFVLALLRARARASSTSCLAVQDSATRFTRRSRSWTSRCRQAGRAAGGCRLVKDASDRVRSHANDASDSLRAPARTRSGPTLHEWPRLRGVRFRTGADPFRGPAPMRLPMMPSRRTYALRHDVASLLHALSAARGSSS